MVKYKKQAGMGVCVIYGGILSQIHSVWLPFSSIAILWFSRYSFVPKFFFMAGILDNFHTCGFGNSSSWHSTDSRVLLEWSDWTHSSKPEKESYQILETHILYCVKHVQTFQLMFFQKKYCLQVLLKYSVEGKGLSLR